LKRRILWVLVIQTSVFLLLGLFYQVRFSKLIDEELVEGARTVGDLIGSGALGLEMAGDAETMGRIVGGEVALGFVAARNGMIYTATDSKLTGRNIGDTGIALDTLLDSQEEPVVQRVRRDGEDMMLIISPVGSAAESRPFLFSGLLVRSTEAHREKLARGRLFLVGSAGGLLLALAAFGLVFHRIVEKQLQRALRVVQRVGAGDLEARVEPVRGRDSIAQLQRGINEMAASLSTTMHSLEQARGDLETRVAERTGELSLTNSRLTVEIAERVQAEKRTREAGALLEGIMANTRILIFVRDLGGRFVMVNNAFAEFFGLPGDAFLGKTPEEIYPEASARANFIAEDRSVLEAGKALTFEHTIPVRGASRSYISIKFPLYDANGEPTGVCGMLTDITSQKRLERELRKANELKNQFLANVSHEIRTPISGIIGVAEILSAQAGDEDVREKLEMILDAAQTLSGLVNDILDFSRIEAGKLEICTEDFALRSQLEAALGYIRFQAERKDLTFEVEVDGRLPDELRGDPMRIRQVLVNLVGNAVKFTDSGSVGVRVSGGARPSSSEPFPLRFEVRDTGPGIPLERQEGLFESFTQVDGSLTRRFGGTGLGLAISKRLVEMMGGEIGLSSTPGEGSLFHFWVPVVLAGVRKAEESEPESPRQDGGLAVLIAEDSPLNRIFVEHMVQAWGHTASSVANGEEALRALTQERFDLVLMDIQMPVMDGLETTRRIRTGHPGVDPNIPIIALTANAIVGDRERFLAAGMDEYVSKPVEADRLAEAIGRVMAGEVVPEPGPSQAASAESGFDDATALEMVGGDAEIMHTLRAHFLERTLPARLEELRTASAAGEADVLREQAHTFKGESGQVCASRLAQLAKRLEDAAIRADLDKAAEVMAAIEAEADLLGR
jgi:PAS domain S-box-containing protein